MRVTVRLFARLREITGQGEIERQVPEGTTADSVWEGLADEFPGIRQYRTISSCAVNEEYASFGTSLAEGDEVAFLPPVSGGSAGQRDGIRGRIRGVRDQGFHV
ncbi:molybdopterin converting factor subunit 1 [soil metagenome]